MKIEKPEDVATKTRNLMNAKCRVQNAKVKIKEYKPELRKPHEIVIARNRATWQSDEVVARAQPVAILIIPNSSLAMLGTRLRYARKDGKKTFSIPC